MLGLIVPMIDFIQGALSPPDKYFPLSASDGADLAGAFLNGAQFLICAQLVGARNWQSAFRDETLACGASIPDRQLSQ